MLPRCPPRDAGHSQGSCWACCLIMTRTEGHGQGGHRDRVTGTTLGVAGGERGKEVKGMEGGKRRWKARRDELREGWLNRCPGVQSREGRGDGKTGDGDTGPLSTCCVWAELMAVGGQTWGSCGSTQDSGQRGRATPRGCQVTWRTWDEGRGPGAAQLGAGREDSWEHRGCGDLGWGRGWIWRDGVLGKIKVKRVKLAEP